MTSAATVTDRPHDPAHFRRVLGHYPTGVSIVTAVDDHGGPLGMVVGSFTSVSLDPPLVAFLAMDTSRTYAQIKPAGRFCVNVLAADQEPLCRAFASRDVDKFADVNWHAAPTGSPILDDAVAWVDCETEVIHSAGDHDLNRPGFYAHLPLREGWRDGDQVRREHQGQGGAAGLRAPR
jgi:flavin reductase (DIM6/NTAB) family NADH-FMN oxidoreductase RutF